MIEIKKGDSSFPENIKICFIGMLYAELARISTTGTGSGTTAVIPSTNRHSNDEEDQQQPTPAKKVCSLFAHYRRRGNVASAAAVGHVSPQQQLSKYLDRINSPDFNVDDAGNLNLFHQEQFKDLRQLFERIMCTPATSAPVERIFSRSGIIMRPHRARMSDSTLETLMFLTCNSNL